MSARASVILLALLCLALGFVAGTLLDEDAGAPPSYLAQLTRDLGLRPEQVGRIEAILTAEDADIAALIGEHRQALQGPIADRRQQTEDAVLAILDQGQRIRYEELTRQAR